MRTKISFARMMATGLMAAGMIAGFSTAALAANVTWTNASVGGAGSNRGKWGTTAQFATNWSGVVNPGSGNVAVFQAAPNSGANPALQSNVTVGGIQFNSGAATFTIQNGTGVSPSPVLTLANAGVAIDNQSTATQTISSQVVAGALNQTYQSAAGGKLDVSNLNLNGNQVTAKGDFVSSALTSTSAGGVFITDGGVQNLGLGTGNNIATVRVLSGTLSTTGVASSTDLEVQGGKYLGGGTFQDASLSGGTLDLTGPNSAAGLNVDKYSQVLGSTVNMRIGYDVSDPLNPYTVGSSVVSNFYTLGGDATITGDGLVGQNLGSQLLPFGTTWSLFTGVNASGGTTPAPLNGATNFSTFVLAAAGSPYAGTFTQFGQEFIGPMAPDGTYMVFQAATGNLVVVPEPSTIVFAGLGVAMSGWTMWKKRRLSKVLAAKAG